MSMRAPSPPSTGYNIIDIRTSSLDMSTGKHEQEERPPSPPSSSNQSEDAFNGSDLVDTILDSLDKPTHQKSIPTYILYDTKGLQLFDQITYLEDEYYLTRAELDILDHHANDIADRLQDGSVLFELGAGALRKTQVMLRAIEAKKVHVTYYALDLDMHELNRSLASLGEFHYVQLRGLLGTYDQGIPWISEHFTGTGTQKNFLWMGSSIGNQNRLESAVFLGDIQRRCMEPGDFFLIGFDKRNDAAKIELAYDDSLGITREFIMNGLDHVNHIMGQQHFMDRANFEYHSVYQEKQGRHLSHYRALVDSTIHYKTAQKEYTIDIKKDELVHVEHSYKYSLNEISSILSAADLNLVDYWLDSKDQYRLVLSQSRPFHFERNQKAVIDALLPSQDMFEQEPINCFYCNEGGHQGIVEKASHPLLSKEQHWPKDKLPTLHEWQELWKSWDLVTQHMLNHGTMLHEKPIDLRHPFIFYLGHIPAFLDIQMSRHQVDQELGPTDLTEPKAYADIFERGIDPDMDDTTVCNPHSQVPSKEEDWPAIDSILAYQTHIRERLQRLLLSWESAAFHSADWTRNKQRQMRIVWMCYEHEAMHLETLLYMLMQSPNTLPPKGVALPFWKLSKQLSITPLTESPCIQIPASTVTLGHNDRESMDFSAPSLEFGWDNEHPERQVNVGDFKIQSRPVTNGEYLAYLEQTNNKTIPASWMRQSDGTVFVRTVFGPCPFSAAQNWPVQTSCLEAEGYAQFKGGRLPSEAELVYFRDFTADSRKKYNSKWPNVGFNHWSPTDVSNEQVHQLGDVWEWTSTIMDKEDGYVTSEIYPGYSSDFFDGKHRIVLGGSWATHPRIAERRSFRNWYQAGYPFVFSGFRLCL